MADNQYGPLQPKQTTASDIRKVVANGTKTTGKGFTIANKEELEQKEASKQNGLPKSVKIGGNVSAKVGANVGLNTGKTIQQTTPVKKEKPQGPVVQPTITPQQITGDLFKNPIVQPINDIKVLHKDGEAVNANGSKMKVQPNQYNYNSSKLIKTDTERKKDLSAGIEALYADAYNKVTDGQQLTLEEVLGNENYKKQFDGVDEGRIQELINDANILAQYDEFDMQNLLSIYDKYKDFGLLLDVNKLSPKSKTAFISAIQGEGDNAIDKGVWQYMDIANVFSPLFWAEKAGEGFVNLTGLSKNKKTTKDLSQQIRERAANNKHDMLNEEEQNFAARDEIAKLDEKYKKYYTIDKDGNKKWNSMSKQNKYDEELMYIQNDVAKKHGDTLGAFWKNAFLNTIEVAATVHDMVANPGELIGGLGSTAVGTAENVASYGWDVYDWVKGNTMALHHKDITQHLANLGGYDNYEEALQSAEYKLKDSPFKDLGMTILKQIQIDSSTAGLMGDYIAESYGSTDKFVESMGERPVETWSDIVSLLELGAFLSGKFGLISPMKSEALIETLGNLDPFELGMKYGNKLNYGPVLKGETAALKIGGKTLKLPFKGVKNMGDMIVNKLSGISEEERKLIRENPDDVDKFIKGEENSQSLIDKIVNKFDELTSDKKKEGEEYETLRNSDTKINTKGLIDEVKEKLKEGGIKITNKGAKLEQNYGSAINNKLQEMVQFINEYKAKGANATAKDTHWLRMQLDTLSKWEGEVKGVEAQAINLIRGVRDIVNNTLKNQVPGMKDVDMRYSALVNEIKALKQDWFNKDGTLKDSAYSKIRNLTNKGANQPKLERLEKLIPGITQDLKALAVADTVEKASKQMVGQYAQQIWGVGGGITAITSLLTGGFSIPSFVLGLLGMQFATPKNLVSLLKFGGRIDKKINGVLDKIKNGTKLTALETAELARYLNENREDLREKAEYMHEKGLLSDEEYKAAIKKIDDAEYARAQQKARNKAGDKEVQLTPEDEKRVKDWIKGNAKNPGFVIKMLDALQMEAKTGDKTTQGFFVDKYINLLENPTDTTAQHEFFHGVFSLVDNKTKAYLIQEARKILKENGMDKVSAEEWLAESFGIYAKRKMIDMGIIKAPRTFEQKLRNFFQKAYEWIQNFNGDRKTINKVFDEIYGGDKKIKNGKLDLSEIIGNKKIDEGTLKEIELGDNGLRKKSVYHGSPADFDKFDSSHMGEGEGAQAHGWGHYVAVEKGTAEKYAEMGKIKNRWKYDGEGIDFIKDTSEQRAKNLLMSQMDYNTKNGGETDPKKVLKELINERKYVLDREIKTKENLEKTNKEWGVVVNDTTSIDKNIKRYRDDIKELEKLDVNKLEKGSSARNLYTSDIPDPKKADTPTGSNYLEEKGKFTQKEINNFIKALESRENELPRTMKWLKEGHIKNGEDLRDTISVDLDSDKAASKLLEKLGYDGIHYFGGRDGEAYVIFNDDALKIKEHIRYKKKIGDKDVEINKDITSPEQMAKVNSKGLSVIHDFISEKQAEKALDVSKDILDKDGNAYLWTHTNKYVANQFANFENVKDSKYKEFSDREVSWFSNSEEMSKSYANQQSVLANTKSPKTEDEFNKFIKSHEKVEKGDNYEQKQYFKVEKNSKGDYVVTENDITKQRDKNLIDFASIELGEAGYVLESMAPEDIVKRIEERVKYNGDYIKISNLKEKNGSYYIDYEEETKLSTIGTYKDKEELYAKVYSKLQPRTQYHYQGIVQNMKNPLVVDYRNPEGTKNYWNKLGTVYEFLEKTDKSQLNKLEKALDEAFGMREEGNIQRRKVWDKIEEESHRLRKEYQKASNTYQFDKPGDAGAKRELERADYLRDSFNKYQNVIYEGLYREFTTNELAQLKDLDALNQWGKFIDLVNDCREKYKDYDIFNTYRGGIGLEKFLEQKGLSKDIISLTHDLPTYDHTLGENIKNGKYALTEKQMQTNDYVFYALNKGDYDGVLFKDISDYGGEGTSKRGGDVLATFNSKQFKAWDNSNPTDSKYISYKKKVSLDKKSEGLQKKNSSGLLAKGRDRMGDNGIRYKAAWHGSPAQFDRFDSSHMGEGEGAQAHGWGHYVAIDKDTAKKYAEMMDEKYTTRKLGGLTAKQWSSKYHGGANDAETYAKWKIANGMQGNFWGTKTLEEAKKNAIFLEQQVLDEYKGWIKDYKAVDIDGEEYYHTHRGLYPAKNIKSEIKKLEDRIKAMQGITEKDLVIENKNIGNRNLYELDIPDPVKKDTPTGSNYFEEGEVISPKAGKKIADKLREKGHAPQDDIFGWSEGYLERLLTSIEKGEKGKAVYEDIAVYLGGQKQASKFLESLGYDGIHYFGGRDGESYVLFNDESPKIKNALRYKKVYHGGGDFDKFDLSHAGEGEGNSAHGYGAYVTENKQRAKEYGDLYRDRKYGKYYFGARNDRFVTYKGKKMGELRGEENERMIKEIMHGMQEENNAYPYYDAESQMAKIRNGFRNQMNVWAGRGENIEGLKADYEKKLKALDSINPKDFKFVDAKRNLYDVEVPDPKKADTPTGTNYLEEGDKISNEAYKGINKQFNKETGLTMKRWSKNVDGKEVYDRLSEGLGSQKKASEFLNDMGYDGIHYVGKLDGSSYVIFNDKTPQIKNAIRYKKGLQKKESGIKDEIKKLTKDWVDYQKKIYAQYDGKVPTVEDEYRDLSQGKKTLYRGETGGWDKQRFWTDDKDIAESFGDIGVTEEKIVIKNPLDIRAPGIEKLLKSELKDIDIDKAVDAYKPDIKEKEKLMDWAAKNGYDAIIGETTDNGMNWKGNEYIMIGDNINNPNIRYKKIPQKWINKGVKEEGEGYFGKIYKGLKDIEAEEFLKEMKGGEVLGAYNYKGLPVDLMWGDGTYGLSKFVDKHSNMLGKIQYLLDTLPFYDRQNNRIRLYDKKTGTWLVLSEVRGDAKRGDKVIDKRWVITSYIEGK